MWLGWDSMFSNSKSITTVLNPIPAFLTRAAPDGECLGASRLGLPLPIGPVGLRADLLPRPSQNHQGVQWHGQQWHWSDGRAPLCILYGLSDI